MHSMPRDRCAHMRFDSLISRRMGGGYRITSPRIRGESTATRVATVSANPLADWKWLRVLEPRCPRPRALPRTTRRGIRCSSPKASSPFPPLYVLRLIPRTIQGKRLSCLAVKSGMGTEVSPASEDRMLVMVPPHPLIKHWISVLRNEQTPCAIFKNALAELGRLLIYEASRDWLPTISGEIQTPMSVATVEFIDPREPVMVIPILRAGLALAEHASAVLPATKTYHLGMRRDETTLQPSVYLNNLPDQFPVESRVLIVDPMLATGGTMVAAIDLVKERGVGNKHIRVVSAVSAPPALQKLGNKFPGLHVYTGMIDPVVNEKGFIVPGLGDAGDRSFGT
ncbi:putative uracil phosphoribosyltransferase [Dioscorea sansibarensis]